ncbi:MAG: YaaA family protein [Anaerococcus sp.]|nr:YaaA family protein [Anaerococcus sp.]
MKVIISPAKRFKHFDNIDTSPLIYPEKTKRLVEEISKLSLNDIGNLNKTNDALTEKAYYDFKEFDFKDLPNPALFSYDGLVFKQFTMDDFKDFSYLNDHVYIISALYGPLKPFTGIRDYRLYFDNDRYDLYDFWKDDIYKEVFRDKEIVINLSSKEYSKTISPFLKKDDRFITIDFKEERDGKLKSIVAYTKQMRGKFLKKIIKDKISKLDEIKKIQIDSYKFDPLLSSEDNFIFRRKD